MKYLKLSAVVLGRLAPQLAASVVAIWAGSVGDWVIASVAAFVAAVAGVLVIINN